MSSNVDDLLKTMGDPGKAQCLLASLMSLSITIVAIHHLSMVFIGSTPPHHCNVSDDFLLNATIPMTVLSNGQETPDQCRMYLDPTNHSSGTTACTNGWTYLYQREEWNVVGEFNLVCQSKYLIGLVSTIYFSGTLLGSIVFGHLADRVGRKPVFLATLYAHALMGVFQYFANSYIMFTGFKFLHGVLIQGMYGSVLCLVMELFPISWRTEASIFMNTMYTIGQFVLVFLAYFIPNWRYFYLASTLPAFGAICFIWLVPESFRWLLVNGRRTEALLISHRFARINKITLDAEWKIRICRTSEIHPREIDANVQKPDFRDLFRTPPIRRTSLVIVYLWFSMAFVYYGISFSFPLLNGDKYLNFVISVAVEFASRSLTYPGLKLIGRRITGLICFLLTGGACIASAVIKSQIKGDAVNSIVNGLAIFARAASSCTFVCVMLHTQESFPTVLRSNALGLGGVFNRIGSMAAPQIVLLSTYSHPMTPLLVLGCIAILAAFVTMLMPETFRSPLPDTVEQAKTLNSKEKLKKMERSDIATPPDSEEPDKDRINNQEMVHLCNVQRLNNSRGSSNAAIVETNVSSEFINQPNSSSSPAILNLADCSANAGSMHQEVLKELQDSPIFRRNRLLCQ